MRESRPKKRLFLGLFSVSLAVALAALAVLWYVPLVGLPALHPRAPLIVGVIFALFGLGLVLLYANLLYSIIRGRSIIPGAFMTWLAVKIFLPLMILVGWVFRFGKDEVRRSFILINNELVEMAKKPVEPDRLLLLMPHCIQNSRCERRLSYNIDNCTRCGRCQVGELLALTNHYGVHFAVATGGSIARRIVVNLKPTMIVAAACERDLASGIQDTYPIPVFGVLNERPFGPCLDTRVDIGRIERVLRAWIKPERLHVRETA